MIAMVSALALIGPSSASALSALCNKEAPEVKGGVLACKAGTKLETAELGGESEGSAVLAVEAGNVECAESTFNPKLVSVLGKVTGTGDMVLKGLCTTTIPTCNIVSFTGSKFVETEVVYVQKTGPEGNFLLLEPMVTFTVTCGGVNFTCKYAGNTGELVTGNYDNGTQKLKINTAVKVVAPEGFFCSKTATLVITYKVELTSGMVGGKAVGKGPVYLAKE